MSGLWVGVAHAIDFRYWAGYIVAFASFSATVIVAKIAFEKHRIILRNVVARQNQKGMIGRTARTSASYNYLIMLFESIQLPKILRGKLHHILLSVNIYNKPFWPR